MAFFASICESTALLLGFAEFAVICVFAVVMSELFCTTVTPSVVKSSLLTSPNFYSFVSGDIISLFKLYLIFDTFKDHLLNWSPEVHHQKTVFLFGAFLENLSEIIPAHLVWSILVLYEL